MSTDSSDHAALPADVGSPGGTPDELPPVTPPSAGFIVQLFLIPALIVAAVIGVWALFSQLAGSEVDVNRLVQELGNTNTHRRWRSALELSQVLQNERIAEPHDGERLSTRRDIAEGLAGLLRESLASEATDDDAVKHQEFLARTMGSLNVDDVVLPALADSMAADVETGVRRSALMSTILIAGRHFAEQTGQPGNTSRSATVDLTPLPDDAPVPLKSPSLDNTEILSELKAAAQDPEPAIRHLAAYALGVVSGPDSLEQLRVLLLDADSIAQANAAIGLSRNGSVDGADVLLKLLTVGANPISEDDSAEQSPEDQQAELARQVFDQSATLVNCMTAVGRLWTRLDESKQAQFISAVESLETSHVSSGVRLHAANLLREIR
jgi:hypothetical protein